MSYINLPFQKINISEMSNYIDKDGKLNSVLNLCGFLLCKKGWVKVRLNESTYVIREGDMYIYAPSAFINIVAWSDDLEGIAFKSTLDYILPFIERATSQRTILNIRSKPCITLNAEQQRSIEELANLIDRKVHIYQQAEEKSNQRKFMKRELECLSEALISEMFLYYVSNESLEPDSSSHKDKIIQTFITSLFKNYKREREVQFYAEQQCLTPRYFSSIVKERTGRTALAWISEMVISSACQMLAYSDLTVKEIALEMNFPTQTFFGKYFKQYVNCSPLQYRQRHKSAEQDAEPA